MGATFNRPIDDDLAKKIITVTMTLWCEQNGLELKDIEIRKDEQKEKAV